MENEKQSTETVLSTALTLLEEANHAANAAGGACIYTPPSGRPKCFQLTPQQCAQIGGSYVGGPCPPQT